MLRNRAWLEAASMVVVGRRGMGRTARFLLGSVSTALSEHPDRPTVIVPESVDGDPSDRRVVVGVDGSMSSLPALQWAEREARLRDTVADPIVVWVPRHGEHCPPAPDDQPAQREARRALDTLVEHLPTTDRHLRPSVLVGEPAEVLVQEADTAALLVVGTRGLGTIRRHVFGSTSQAVLRQSHTVLAVIPCPEGGHTRRCLPGRHL